MVAHNGAETAPGYDKIATAFTVSYFLQDGLNQLNRKRLTLNPLPKLHRKLMNFFLRLEYYKTIIYENALLRTK